MFFTKYIKNNIILNRIVIVLSNTVITFLKVFNFYRKNFGTENIVVIALQKLGDSVFTIPALKNIVNYYGENIYVICFPETEPIYRIVFNSVNFVNIEHSEIRFNNRIASRRAKKILRDLKPSTIYDLTGTITSATLIFMSSAKKIIGINESYYRPIYTNFRKVRLIPHLIDNYLDAIRDVIPITVTSYFGGQNNYGSEYILIHPFTSLEEKEWGLKNYISLAEYLNENYKCVMVVPNNKIQRDVAYELQQKKIDLIETKSVSELIEVTKRCSVFIGNDSGPTNIANLLMKPTFTIYGPTNPDFHKPKEGLNDFIIKRRNCSPQKGEKMCFTQRTLKGCPAFECMNNLTLDEVKIRVMKFIHLIEDQGLKLNKSL